ncbi:MAG: DDE-type integrase/transposase/recombinase [Bryobacteraceae bacterium]
MNKLTNEKRAQVIAALVEGNSIRSIVRMTGVAKNTIAKLLLDLGEVCTEFLNNSLVNLPATRVQCDEIWSFVGAKQKNVTPALRAKGHAGDIWTWVAMDADTKLICAWMVGPRDSVSAYSFIHDLQERLANRVQLTTDGNRLYLNAIDSAFKGEVDYAMLIKVYGNATDGKSRETFARYSPPVCLGCDSHAISGTPDIKHVSTSYVERQNLTMRMSMRRFTRLTNAFSKKLESHKAAIALHYMHYNFCRVHQSLRVTPAMAAGLADHVWEISELISLL